MHKRLISAVTLATAVVASAALVSAGPAGASPAAALRNNDGPTHGVTQTNLVSDQEGVAQVTDENLVNAWGLAHGPSTPLWVSAAHAQKSTVYKGAVNGSPASKSPDPAKPLVVDIPGGEVTGQTFNGTPGFTVPGTTTPSAFLFATKGGSIDAWAPTTSGTQAAVATTVPGASYTGLTVDNSPFGPLLLASDFQGGHVDVFNSEYRKLDVAGLFHDPFLPRGYSPFNVQVAGDSVYVAYALRGKDGDDAAGAGRGFVDRFTSYGTFAGRIASGGPLNSPWGLVIAPQTFGQFAGDLLVGNNGDGTIHAYDAVTGRFRGTLRNTQGKVIRIDELWGLIVGNQVTGGPDSILFSAGPDDENHGLVGLLTAN